MGPEGSPPSDGARLNGHRGDIWKYLRFTWGLSREDADDVASDMIEKALKAPRILDFAYPESYLREAAKNALMDAHRHAAVEQRRAPLLMPPDTVEDHSQTVDANLLWLDHRTKCGTQCTQACYLVIVMGYKYEEAAEFLGISRHTVKRLLSRGRKHFAALLKGENEV